MTGRFPDSRMTDDRAVDADDVSAASDDVVPPRVFDVALQLGAGGAVVPEPVDTAVDFAGLEDEAAPFAERDDFVHQDRGSHKWRGLSHDGTRVATQHGSDGE